MRSQVERDLGITVSIGLSANKFLAKIASDMDKPRGFAVLGQDEAVAFLAPKPVGFIYGVGAVSAAKLAADGYRLIADLQRADEHDLMRRYGEEGARLWRLARGHRRAQRRSGARDQEHFGGNDVRARHRRIPPARADAMGSDRKGFGAAESQALAGSTVTLKLKSADFKIRTRARALGRPTQLAARIFAAGRDLLRTRWARRASA